MAGSPLSSGRRHDEPPFELPLARVGFEKSGTAEEAICLPNKEPLVFHNTLLWEKVMVDDSRGPEIQYFSPLEKRAGCFAVSLLIIWLAMLANFSRIPAHAGLSLPTGDPPKA